MLRGGSCWRGWASPTASCGVHGGALRRNPDPELVARNRSLTRTRFAVERSFAWMKRWYGYRRVRYRGLVRNGLQLHLMCIALNLRRALALRAA